MRPLVPAFFLTVATVCGSALGAKHLPSYKHLYSFAFHLGGNHLIEGPLGTRWGLGALGCVSDVQNHSQSLTPCPPYIKWKYDIP